MSACGEPTYRGGRCRKAGRWLSGYNTRSRCYRHAVKTARDENAETIVDVPTGRCLVVADIREPRKARRMPKTVEGFIEAFNACDGSDGRWVSNLMVAALESLPNGSLGGRTSPLRQAMLSAKGRVHRHEMESATC